MASEGITDAFAGHAFLRDLSERHLLKLASGVRPFAAKAGEYLGRMGEPANAFYLLQAGHVALLVPTPSGEPVNILTVGPGDVIGWSWLVPPHRWQFDCRAEDEARGLALDAEWLRWKCEQDHELGYHVVKQLLSVIAARLLETRRHVTEPGK